MILYNPYITCYFKVYINVEACSSVEAIKYIHKYIYKSLDCTTI